MVRFRWFQSVAFVAALTAPCAVGARAAVTCEKLASFDLKGGTITGVHLVAAGQFTPPQQGGAGGPGGGNAYQKLPAFCRVEATLKPSADSEIKIEVWLPEFGWNGKLVESGNGGYGSSLGYGTMAKALSQGYAATSSNTGHEGGNSAAFVIGHPEKLIDWAYRAVHENAVAAKAIVEARYGNTVKRAYFEGCSTGGRQAYGEAQRYPVDFDGIVAGDPGKNLTHQTAMQTWMSQEVHKVPAAFITAEKYTMMHKAVLAACDELDGVKDGVIENPLKCKFDPGTLLCKGADSPDCLSAPQVEFSRKVYAGPTSPSGKKVFGGLMPGSEGWSLAGPNPMIYALDSYRYVVMQNPNWDYMTLDLDRDVEYADKTVAALVNNNDPNIQAFFARGGKLLAYHGWADPSISPFNSIDYYNDVAKLMGGVAKIDNEYRLFMIPGMAHCGGGDGTSTFDMIPAIDAWVEKGQVPASIPASRTRNGAVDRTRPLCPYPQQAVYKGSGSTDDAANFTCAVAK
jgi:Tannase and feruloyl esterase